MTTTFKKWWKKQEADDTEVWNESSELSAEQIWKAATMQERERAAKVCEGMLKSDSLNIIGISLAEEIREGE